VLSRADLTDVMTRAVRLGEGRSYSRRFGDRGRRPIRDLEVGALLACKASMTCCAVCRLHEYRAVRGRRTDHVWRAHDMCQTQETAWQYNARQLSQFLRSEWPRFAAKDPPPPSSLPWASGRGIQANSHAEIMEGELIGADFWENARHPRREKRPSCHRKPASNRHGPEVVSQAVRQTLPATHLPVVPGN